MKRKRKRMNVTKSPFDQGKAWPPDENSRKYRYGGQPGHIQELCPEILSELLPDDFTCPNPGAPAAGGSHARCAVTAQ